MKVASFASISNKNKSEFDDFFIVRSEILAACSDVKNFGVDFIRIKSYLHRAHQILLEIAKCEQIE
jgi:hypothetical protein